VSASPTSVQRAIYLRTSVLARCREGRRVSNLHYVDMAREAKPETAATSVQSGATACGTSSFCGTYSGLNALPTSSSVFLLPAPGMPSPWRAQEWTSEKCGRYITTHYFVMTRESLKAGLCTFGDQPWQVCTLDVEIKSRGMAKVSGARVCVRKVSGMMPYSLLSGYF
jgi:hypothetical protein